MATKAKPQKTADVAVSYPTDGLARVPEAAKFLAVSRDTIYNMIKDGELASTEVRDAIRVPWKVLHEFAKAKVRKAGR